MIEATRKIAGTAHSSAVTNLDAFDAMLQTVEKGITAGTAHSSAVTNLDAFEVMLQTYVE